MCLNFVAESFIAFAVETADFGTLGREKTFREKGERSTRVEDARFQHPLHVTADLHNPSLTLQSPFY